jgi:predicted DNA-binding transcriptional regulator AlpA
MMEYDFKLNFKIPADGPSADELVERLGAAGCDDALVGIGKPGRIALDFSREAETAQEAIVSALADVKKAIPGAKLIEVSPDFVGLTEVADFVGVSRQNMRKLWLAHPTNFPAPIHEGNSALWHLAFVLQWLQERGTYRVERALLEVARTAMQVNLAKEADHIAPRVQQELRELVA